MRKYAVLSNNVIIDVQLLDETDECTLHEFMKFNEAVIDIEDLVPQPVIGWVLNGNKLEIPSGNSSRELYEYELAQKKTIFGIRLARIAINKIGARNKILNKNGTQVGTLLTQLLPIKLLLETGALGTARYSCSLLRDVYTEYSDIFDLVISEINIFESANTL